MSQASGRPDPDRVGRWLGRLGHDLRNQLAPMRTASQFLLSRNVDEARQKELLEMVDRQVGRLAHMLDDLSELGQLVSASPRRHEAHDLGILVDTAVGQCARYIAGDGIDFDQSMPPDRLPVHGDRRGLTQAIVRLLDNARRFTPRGGTIRLSLDVIDGMGRVRVRDSGAGIEPERFDEIFDLPDAARGSERLGISLLLARACAVAHGGNLEVRSDGPGTGSEFELRVPISSH